jgi:hypothetical protein
MKPMQLKSIVAVLLAACVTGTSHAAEVSGRVIGLRGEAQIIMPGSTAPVPLQKGQLVPAGAQVVTGDKGRVILGLLPGAATILSPNTTLAVRRLSLERTGDAVAKRDVQLELQSKTGSAISFLKKMDGASDFSVKTPFGVAAARGTVWKTTSTRVITVSGQVTVTLNNGDQVSVPSGSTTDASGETSGISDEDIRELKAEFEELGYEVEIANDPDGNLIFRVKTPSGELIDTIFFEPYDANNPANTLDTSGNKTNEESPSDTGYSPPDMQETE